MRLLQARGWAVLVLQPQELQRASRPDARARLLQDKIAAAAAAVATQHTHMGSGGGEAG